MKSKYSKTRIPRKLKIGYADFAIVPRSKKWGMRNKAIGDCSPEIARIQFVRTQKKSELVNTILHEMLHGIVYMFDINFKNSEEEELVIRKLANGLHTVFRDNPKFIKWITENLKHNK